MKILIINKKDKTTEILVDDDLVWEGFLEETDTIEDILAAIGCEVERVDHEFDDSNTEVLPEEEYFDPYDQDDMKSET